MAIPAFEVVFFPSESMLLIKKRRKIPPFMMVCPNRHPLSEPYLLPAKSQGQHTLSSSPMTP